MNFVRIIEISTIVLLVVFFVSQVFVPIWRGRPVFPLFRGKHKILAKLDEAREKKDEKELGKEIGKTNR